MEGLIVALALLLGTALAIGVSMAGLQLIISFVPDPTSEQPARRTVDEKRLA